MDCYKCGKDMDNPEGSVPSKGASFQVTLNEEQRRDQGHIEYLNKQLGKYGDGMGECDVAICYECFIDNQFGVSRHD